MLRFSGLSLEARMLLSYMQSLSEDYHHCAWVTGMEYTLWNIVETGRSTADWPISAQEIADLQALRAGINHGWVRYRELAEILADYGVSRWEELTDRQYVIPQQHWYQLYTRTEWEGEMMQHSL